MGYKAFTISDDESGWRDFLYDLDCKDSAAVQKTLAPGHPTTKRADFDTVVEAQQEAMTIVTSNASDFIRFTMECQKRDNRNSCEDCWGLVVVPNRELDREYSLRKADIRSGVKIAGDALPWKAVGYANLCVTINREGLVRLSRFERCQFCERAHPLMNQPWYASLPVARAPQRPEKPNKTTAH